MPRSLATLGLLALSLPSLAQVPGAVAPASESVATPLAGPQLGTVSVDLATGTLVIAQPPQIKLRGRASYDLSLIHI